MKKLVLPICLLLVVTLSLGACGKKGDLRAPEKAPSSSDSQ